MSKKQIALKPAKLILEDGSEFEGWAFGKIKPAAGEVIFNTGMSGLTQALTDPACKGQIFVSTWPIAGNCGVSVNKKGLPFLDEHGIPIALESEKIQVSGLVISDLCEEPGHYSAKISLSEWLEKQNTPGIYGIDTRALAIRLRERGTMRGKILIEGIKDISLKKIDMSNHSGVSHNKIQTYIPAINKTESGEAAAGSRETRAGIKIAVIDCGVKANLIRCLLNRGVEVIRIPCNIDFSNIEYDGLIFSSGPGDPKDYKNLIEAARKALSENKPVFGVGLGCLIMALASGADTYKLPSGHRGQNHPSIKHRAGRESPRRCGSEAGSLEDRCKSANNDILKTLELSVHNRCYVTSQNHGYSIRPETLPLLEKQDWTQWFTNANDGSIEGIKNKTKPFSAVLFYPEGCPGSRDTEFLFDRFISQVKKIKNISPNKLSDSQSSSNSEFSTLNSTPFSNSQLPKKVLILGSGGLKIGQAGEFDYSGSQAIKALREEGIKTILINPNIATIQTSEGMAESIYFLPITPEFVRKVIEKEKPDAMLLSFGGQTALNCGVALGRDGTLSKNNVRVLGTPVKTIEDTEDRHLFVKRLDEIGALTPRSAAVTDTASALKAADEIGYPVMARVAFALGGAGSGICKNEAELEKRCAFVFARKNEIDTPPQVLVEEWLGGWKEIEFEIVRDAFDNCITVASMENFDPLGIHTGESIVVAPAQTLTDSELGKLRRIAIDVIRHLGIVGECNIQFALDPFSQDYRIIEVNARLSRSSALASKATGYPLAFIAAKIALGHSLLEIENRITRVTKSCFEPALDYIVVKVPRWDLTKFKNVDIRIGSEMKSVGEVMSIARTFEEAIQKALRMTGIGAPGLAGDDAFCGIKSCEKGSLEAKIRGALSEPTDRRIYVIYRALSEGWSVEKIYKLSKIDKWFLNKIANVWKLEQELRQLTINNDKDKSSVKSSNKQQSPVLIPPLLLARAKQLGFSDARIGACTGLSETQIRVMRKEYRILPAIKQIDTLASEYPAKNNYLYMTYGSAATPGTQVQFDDVSSSGRGVMVLGSGVYRIGSSVEFDWCCVNAVQTARNLGRYSIMVNCNPETVSTDYDMCDRLYFEELTLERVLDIYERENPDGVIVSMGGQIPNNLATKLYDYGVHIFGTAPQSIDKAEDRNKFSALLDTLGIGQPEWKELTDLESAKKFAKEAGYPVLIRPSYVLSGAAMNVAWDDSTLEKFLNLAADVSPEHPVVISKFIENSREIEIDAVARKGEILFHAFTEHIENAGVHSGDATVVLPAQKLYVETVRRIRQISEKIAKALDITGPFNIQFLAQRGNVRVIECNLRSSRSFPFCSKVSRVNMIELAVKAMLDEPVEKSPVSALELQCVGVKAAQFSFSRLHGADPVSGVEMASTGEVGCIGSSVSDALLKALISTGYKIPQGKGKVLLSTGPIVDKLDFLDSAEKLVKMGHELFASRGTAKFLSDNNVPVTALFWPLEKKSPNIADFIKKRGIDMIINIPKNNAELELKNDYLIRRMAIDFDIPLFTNIKVAKEFIDALVTLHNGAEIEIKAWDEYCF